MPPFTPPPPPNHMRALFHASHNQPRYHLLPGTLPIPKPEPGKTALIKVRAAAVTPNDISALPHHRQLYIPGKALSGELITDTATIPSGTKVAAMCENAAWAEYCVVPENCIWPIDTTFEEAAALAAVVCASVLAVRAAGIREGSLVVVSGGVTAAGCVIAQIANMVYGARVVLGVRGPSQVSIGNIVGAEMVVDREREKVHERLNGEVVDVGFDTMGEAKRLSKIVKKDGKVIRVMPVGEERVMEYCRKQRVELVDVHASFDDATVEVVQHVLKGIKLRAACGPVFGVARWLLALEEAEKRVDAGCVVIMF